MVGRVSARRRGVSAGGSQSALPNIGLLLLVFAVILATLPNAVLALPGDGYDPEVPDPGDETPWEPPGDGFGWHVPERFTQLANGRFNWHYNESTGRYDDSHVRPAQWPVNIYGCRTEADAYSPTATEDTYTFVRAGGQPVSGNRCAVQLQFPREGSYEVRMTVTDPSGVRTGDWTNTVVVKDLLIVVLGDSYASGEGNPEFRRTEGQTYGDWVDDRCHRSSYAGSAQAARQLERSDPKTSVTYLSFACSGATINRDYLDHDPKPDIISNPDPIWDPYLPGHPDKNVGSGVLGPYRGAQPPDPDDYADKIPSQLDQLRNALALDTTPAGEARQVDALLMSAGGNDAGFGILAAACLVQDDCNDASVKYTGVDGAKVTLATRVAQDLATMGGRYGALNDALEAIPNLDVAGTYVTEYPDPGTELDGDGNVVECGEILEDIMWGLGMEIEGTHDWDYPDSELAFARNAFLPGLNGALQDAADDFGWHYVGGISARFAGHGYCVGPNDSPDAGRYVRTAAMSSVYQGPDQREKTLGTLHPNEAGHRVYRDEILREVTPQLASVTPDHNISYVFDRTPPTASATVAPAPNLDGWNAGPASVIVSAQPGGTNTLSHVEHQVDGGPWHRTSGAQATVPVSGDGEHIVRYRAIDTAENVSVEGSTTVRIDTIDPTAAITVPGDASVHVLGAVVPVDYACADDGSGIATCTGPVENGDHLDTTAPGAHAFTVKAVDVAGNDFSASVAYEVTYAICPLFDQSRSYRVGQAVPIRLQLCDSGGGDVSAADVAVTATDLTKIDDSSPGVIEDTGNANPDGGFRHDPVLSGYVYNLSTKGLSSGTWELTFEVGGDDIDHSVTFGLR